MAMILFPLLVLFLFLLILLGGALVSSWVLEKVFFPNGLRKELLVPLGFSMFPVFLSWGGLIGIWRPLFSASLAGMLLASVGAVVLFRMAKSHTSARLLVHWKLWSLPLLIVLFIIRMKWGYLFGGILGGDEARSIVITSAFATNALMPALPYNFSLPYVYPFYLFESAAFLHRVALGTSYPSVALLSVALMAIAISYRMIFLICRRIFTHANREFLFTSVLLTFSGFRDVSDRSGFLSFIQGPFAWVTPYFDSGTHYFFGVIIGILGVVYLAEFLRGGEADTWLLAVCCLFFCFGFAGIPFCWLALGAFVVFLNELKITPLRHCLGRVPLVSSLLLFIILIGPQIFSVLPKGFQLFSLSWPHLWFPDALDFVHPTMRAMAIILSSPLLIFMNAGPFLMIGFIGAFVLAFRIPLLRLKDDDWQRLLPLCICVVVSAFIFTFTRGSSGDWYARGSLVPLILSAFIGAKIISSVFSRGRRMYLLVLGIPLLAIQVFSFVLGMQNFAPMPSRLVQDIHTQFPFGTVFYEETISSHALAAAEAGMATLTRTPPDFQNKMNSRSMLEQYLGVHAWHLPCNTSYYSSNTPNNWYYDVGLSTVVRCKN